MTISCVVTKATRRSGAMCTRIPCALDSFVAPKTGRMQVRLCESIERDTCAVASAVLSGAPGPNALRTAHTTADCPQRGLGLSRPLSQRILGERRNLRACALKILRVTTFCCAANVQRETATIVFDLPTLQCAGLVCHI